MESGNGNNRHLREMRFYLKKSLKFYDMKNEAVTPVIFTVILFISFTGVFIPRSEGWITAADIVYNTLSIIFVTLASSVYLISFLKELKGEEYTFASSIRLIARRSVSIIAASALYFAAVLSGFVLLLVPGVIVYVTFLFYNCFLIEAKTGIIRSLTESKNLSRGRKLEIFGMIAVLNVILMPVMMFVVFTFSGSEIILSFVLTFVGTVMNIVQQRLTALIYADLRFAAR